MSQVGWVCLVVGDHEFRAGAVRIVRETGKRVTHARTRAARYLGYEIIVQHCDTKVTRGRRTINGVIALRVPLDVIKAKSAPYWCHGKPWHRSRLQNLDDYDIVATYAAEYRGIVGYYQLAHDVRRLNSLRWYALTSMLKTLGAPRGALTYRPRSGHELEEVFVGPMPYPDP